MTYFLPIQARGPTPNGLTTSSLSPAYSSGAFGNQRSGTKSSGFLKLCAA